MVNNNDRKKKNKNIYKYISKTKAKNKFILISMGDVSMKETPSWFRKFIDEIDSIGKNMASPTPGTDAGTSSAQPDVPTKQPPKPATNKVASPTNWIMVQRVTSSMCFILGAIGLAFSIVCTIFLSSVEENCAGYNEETQQFLYIMSILLTIFFGLIMFASAFSVAAAFF